MTLGTAGDTEIGDSANRFRHYGWNGVDVNLKTAGTFIQLALGIEIRIAKQKNHHGSSASPKRVAT